MSIDYKLLDEQIGKLCEATDKLREIGSDDETIDALEGIYNLVSYISTERSSANLNAVEDPDMDHTANDSER